MGSLEGTIYQGMYVPLIYTEITAARLLLCISPVYHKVHLCKFPNQVPVIIKIAGFLFSFIYRKDQNASRVLSVYTSDTPAENMFLLQINYRWLFITKLIYKLLDRYIWMNTECLHIIFMIQISNLRYWQILVKPASGFGHG